MALDLRKIKGISDEVKAKLANVKNKEEMDAVLKAENLTVEQLKDMAGGSEPWCGWDCVTEGLCFGARCKALPI